MSGKIIREYGGIIKRTERARREREGWVGTGREKKTAEVGGRERQRAETGAQGERVESGAPVRREGFN